MRNSILLASIAVVCLVAASPVSAQVSRDGLVSRMVARQYGLERAWFTHVELDRARSRIAHVVQHISSTRGHTEFEVKYGGESLVFSERHLDPFGEPLGVERAQQLAEAKIADIQAAGAASGNDAAAVAAPELIKHVIPEITLYVATDTSVVHAIDGETGRTRWASQVGRRDHPTMELGVNDQFLALINGSFLYVISSETGEVVWSRQTVGVPGAGPALSESLVHVPMINGSLEAYDLVDPSKPALITKSHGKSLVQPTATPQVVAWGTERGHLYVADSSQQGIRYRLEAKDTIVSPAAYSAEKGLLLVTSIDGYLYCVAERSGNLLWRYSTGQPITASPVVIGDRVYIVTDEFNLFCIALENGEEMWLTPRVGGFIAESQENIFCSDDRGRLTILSRESGGRIGAAPTEFLDLKFVNTQTDRIFIGSSTGIIQCLRKTDAMWPLLHVGIGELGQEPMAEEAPMDDADQPMEAKPPADKQDDNPFGGANPFGGENPFGAGDDKPAAADDKPPAADEPPPGENPFG